jgi:hypothetical protein
MTLSLTEFAAMIPEEKGRLRTLSAVAALANRKSFPISALMNWMPKMGSSYTANFSGGTAEAATRAMNAEFTASNPTPTQKNFVMRAAGGGMPLDINQIDSDMTGAVRDGLLTQKIVDVGAKLFRQWFQGEHTDTAQFDGANYLANELGNIVSAGVSGAVVTAALMDQLLNLVPGANLILANSTVADQIVALTTQVARIVQMNAGAVAPAMWGRDYKGVPVLKVLTAPADAGGAIGAILPATDWVASGVARGVYAGVPATIARNTAYVVGDWRKPTSGTQYLRCSVAGTSHATTEPTWTGTQGAEDTDGTAKFVNAALASRVCTRVTAVRLGLDGVYGIHNRMLEIAAARRAGAFEYHDMNWFMAPIVYDTIDAIAQLCAVKEA